MQVCTIHETEEFRVTSHGNGTSYEIRELTGSDERSVFFQGDDASSFRDELIWYVDTYGETNGLRHVWGEYEEIAS